MSVVPKAPLMRCYLLSPTFGMCVDCAPSGNFKPVLNRAACADSELFLDEIKTEIEAYCKNTLVCLALLLGHVKPR